jgi:hypothetical protein
VQIIGVFFSETYTEKLNTTCGEMHSYLVLLQVVYVLSKNERYTEKTIFCNRKILSLTFVS